MKESEGPTATLCTDGDVKVLEYQHPLPTGVYDFSFLSVGRGELPLYAFSFSHVFQVALLHFISH
jgi:hypothetical protein